MAYYTLAEPEGSTQANDSSGAHAEPLLMVGTGTAVVFGTATGPAFDGLTAATFAGGKYLACTRATYPAVTDSFTAETFFSTSGTGAILLRWGDLQLEVDLTGKLFVSVGGGGASVQSTSTVNDGATRHGAAVCTVTGSNITAVDLYVDGSLTGISWAGSVANTTRPDLRVGNSDLTGVLAHIATYGSALSATRIAAHANAGLTGFAGDTPAQRLARYATYASVPAAETSFETGDVPGGLAHIDTTGKTVLQVMREVETTEGGVLFDAGDGTLKFHDRSHRYGAVSAFTVPASVVVSPLTPILDDQQLVNDMTATGSTGVTARVTDADSITDHDYYRDSIALASSNDDEPLMAASWRVNRYADPLVGVPSIVISLNKCSDALTHAILYAEVGTRFTVTDLPANGPATSMDLFVEGIAEHVDAAQWLVTFRTSPAALSDVWQLDSATHSQLGTTTRLGY